MCRIGIIEGVRVVGAVRVTIITEHPSYRTLSKGVIRLSTVGRQNAAREGHLGLSEMPHTGWPLLSSNLSGRFSYDTLDEPVKIAQRFV